MSATGNGGGQNPVPIGTNINGYDNNLFLALPSSFLPSSLSTGTGTWNFNFYGYNAGVSGNSVNTSSLIMTMTGAGNVGIGTNAPQVALDVNSNSIRVETPHTPASSSETCLVGTIE